MQKIRNLMRSKKGWLLLLFLGLVTTAGTVVIDDNGSDGGDKPGADVLGTQLEDDLASGIRLGRSFEPKPDKVAPKVVLSFPGSGGAYGVAAWDGGCSPAGVCGTASDPSGVAEVELSVRQLVSGRWLSNAGFDSNTEIFHQASGTTTWTYQLARPADGTYRVSVRATDAPGNTSALRTVNFRVDTAPPPTPVIVRHPEDVTFDSSAEFGFDNAESGVTYRCQLDGATLRSCGRNVTFRAMDPGDHNLKVWTVDAAGNQSTDPASWSWTIAPRRDFVVSSGDGEVGPSTEDLLAPGRGVALDVLVSNPFKFPLRVIDIAVSLGGATKNGQPNPDCSPSDSLTVTNSNFAGEVVVPPNSAKSLSDLQVPSGQWPQVQMLNLDTNQNACKLTTFQLSYKGTGTKS